MPNIRSQRIDNTGLEIIASDGRSISITRADVFAHFDSLSGGKPAKITATIQWVKDQIVSALGEEQVPVVIMDFTWHDVKGIDRFSFNDI
jgi:hypothetical protein